MKRDNVAGKREFLYFSLVFLMTVVAWIVVEVYHLEKNKKFTVEYQESMGVEIKPLPKVDILEKLEGKK